MTPTPQGAAPRPVGGAPLPLAALADLVGSGEGADRQAFSSELDINVMFRKRE